MRISDLAKRTGCHLETVRYYERIGLLPKPDRSIAGYRQYGETDVERLQFIVRSRALGFHLYEIKSLLTLASESTLSCQEVDALARNHLAQVQAKQQELAALAKELHRMIDTCHKDTRETCTILRGLSGSQRTAA
jgi:MerR family mercuric resistance operon transcriptional regulator